MAVINVDEIRQAAFEEMIKRGTVFKGAETGRFSASEPNLSNREEAIQRVIDKAVKVAVKDAVAWLVAENEQLAQKVEDLEIELEIEKSAWAEPDDNVIFPKHRGIFKDEN